MEPLLLPVFLKLCGRRALLVGGGRVAATTIDTLLRTGASVTVVAPDIRDDICRPGVEVRRRPFEPHDLDGVWFVVAAATPNVNRQVRATAETRRIFVNTPDDSLTATALLGAWLAVAEALPYEEAKLRAIEQFQRRYTEHLMYETDGNISAAARKANLSRAALHRILKRLELTAEEERAVEARNSPPRRSAGRQAGSVLGIIGGLLPAAERGAGAQQEQQADEERQARDEPEVPVVGLDQIRVGRKPHGGNREPDPDHHGYILTFGQDSRPHRGTV